MPNLRNEAIITKFPPYDGLLQVSGRITLRFTDTEIIINYVLWGLQPFAEEEVQIRHSAEISIHSGRSCASENTAWESYAPKTAMKYVADSTGYSEGVVRITQGSLKMGRAKPYMFAKRVVLIYDRDGTKVACGVLKHPWRTTNLYARLVRMGMVVVCMHVWPSHRFKGVSSGNMPFCESHCNHITMISQTHCL